MGHQNQAPCHQPPKPPCSESKVPLNKIKPTVCYLLLGDSYSHTFDHPGYLTYFPMGHFDPPLPIGFFAEGYTTAPVTSIQPGVITMIYVDTKVPDKLEPYVELLVITTRLPKCSRIEDPSASEEELLHDSGLYLAQSD